MKVLNGINIDLICEYNTKYLEHVCKQLEINLNKRLNTAHGTNIKITPMIKHLYEQTIQYQLASSQIKRHFTNNIQLANIKQRINKTCTSLELDLLMAETLRFLPNLPVNKVLDADNLYFWHITKTMRECNIDIKNFDQLLAFVKDERDILRYDDDNNYSWQQDIALIIDKAMKQNNLRLHNNLQIITIEDNCSPKEFSSYIYAIKLKNYIELFLFFTKHKLSGANLAFCQILQTEIKNVINDLKLWDTKEQEYYRNKANALAPRLQTMLFSYCHSPASKETITIEEKVKQRLAKL